MKPHTMILSCSAAAAITFAGWAQTQQPDRRPGQRQDQRQTQRAEETRSLQERTQQRERMLHHVADIHGLRVENLMGENLGSIDTLIADTHNGQVSYAIVSVGGFLGIGDTLIAVPWEAFQQRPMFEGLVLDVSRSELEAAPTFSRDRWPNFGDENWSRQTHDYYGTSPGVRQRGMRDRDQQRDQQWERDGQRQRDRQPGQQQMQQIQQHLQQAFTRAGISQQEAQRHAQQLAQRIQQEQPDQQRLQQMIQQAMTQAGVQQQQAQQEAQRVAQQIQPMMRQDQQPDRQQPDRTQRDRTQPDRTQQRDQAARTAQFISTDALIGTKVENRTGENLGNLDNLAMEIETGEIEFAVVGVGGFLGMWQSHVAVPWQAMQITQDGDRDYRVVLDATREQLDRAPEYEMDRWPQYRDVDWADGVFPGVEIDRERRMRDTMRDQRRDPARQPTRQPGQQPGGR